MKKVLLTYYDVTGALARESIWAKEVDAYFQVDNIPFFAPNIAVNDIIQVEDDNGVLHFEELISASEHSTIQIILLNRQEKDRISKEIENLQCAWEGFKDYLLAVDVPFSINYDQLKTFLEHEFSRETLDYKEACLSDTHRRQVYED